MIISNVKFHRGSGVVEIDYHEDGKDKTLAMTPMQIVLAFKAQKVAQQSEQADETPRHPYGCDCVQCHAEKIESFSHSFRR